MCRGLLPDQCRFWETLHVNDISCESAKIRERNYVLAHEPSRRQPFPPDSKGFFYYYQPHGLSQIAGELCFCVTPTSSPASLTKVQTH
jgi:hypothetical protein